MKKREIDATPLIEQTNPTSRYLVQLGDNSSIPMISCRNTVRCCGTPKIRTAAEPGQISTQICYTLLMLGASAAAVYFISLNFAQPVPPVIPPAPPLPTPSSSHPTNHSNSSSVPSPSSLPFHNTSNSSSYPSPSPFSPSSSSSHSPETAESQLSGIITIIGIGLINLPVIYNTLRLIQLQIRQKNFQDIYERHSFNLEPLNNILLHNQSNETLEKFIEEIKNEYQPSCACASPSSSKLHTQLLDTHSEEDIPPTMLAIYQYCRNTGNHGKRLFSAINAAASTVQQTTSPFATHV